MAGPVEVAEATLELERATGVYSANFETFLAAHPELETIVPPRVPGWAAFVAVGAYWLGTIPTRPEGTPMNLVQLYEATANDLRKMVDYLETHELTREEARFQLHGIQGQTRLVAHLRQALERVAPPAEVVTPSPTEILRQELAQLRRTTAVQELWRRGHHAKIHGPLTTAEARLAGAEISVASATASGLAATVSAIRAVVTVKLPELRHELVTLLREEAQLRRGTDQELRVDLRTEIRRVVERIGEVVRWLRTEALPELREQVRLERIARHDADQELRDELRAERQHRLDADLELQTGLATLLGVTLPPVLHATEKVRRTEGVFDQLMRGNDLNWAAQLLSAGPFVALAGGILGRVAGRIPSTLGALEESAARALGAI